ncbi:LacI family DNA-binding transcriptional regulator [Bordetella avium]|uniref:LacI family DNA-binding transcriptional regulator n=1 Tax=Bordetella avium TaxID=521 RepID=UPI0039FD9C23
MKPSIRRPTLADVAKLAGVSLGSASRALSVPNEVKPATLERVNRAVAQLGYIRDGAAAALASRRTRTVGAVYPTLNNPIYAHSTHSMQQTLWEMGYQLLIASHEYHIDDEAAVLRATVERGVDGIIMVGTDHSEEVFALLHQRSLPYVLTWSVDDSNYPHCVGISNYTAAYDLARCVLARGHTRVGICGGPIERNERARGRRNGVLGALREQGLSVPAEWINEQPFSFEGGRQAIREYWSRPERPSVIFFGTDLLAMGALHECRRLGIAVPEQLSIVGFDGIDEDEMMQPELTTVSIPAQEIGRRAARHIVDLIEDREPASSGPLPHTVLERGSLGAPATAPRRAAKTETRA